MMAFPSFSRRRAIWIAAHTAAPEETSVRISLLSILLPMAKASPSSAGVVPPGLYANEPKVPERSFADRSPMYPPSGISGDGKCSPESFYQLIW